MERPDSELMREFRDGDRRAFEQLVDRYADRVYSFVRRLAGDDHAAEDAAQETFIKVWKNRSRFNPDRAFRPWLFAIARNATLDVMRKRKDRAFSQMLLPEGETFEEGIADEAETVPDTFDRSVLQGALEETMKTLTPDQRAIVMLHDIEGLTFEEAGKAMKKPMNTVKSHYRRAIAALRKRLGEKGY